MNYDKLVRIAQNNIELCDSEKRHFSFILLRNKVVSFGWNRAWKSHPIAARLKYRFQCQHSELHAILNFPYPISELRKFTMVNIRVRYNGTLGLSKPCKFCNQLLWEFGVSKLFYSNNNGDFESWG